MNPWIWDDGAKIAVNILTSTVLTAQPRDEKWHILVTMNGRNIWVFSSGFDTEEGCIRAITGMVTPRIQPKPGN